MPDVIGYLSADWHVPPAPGAGAWVGLPGVTGDALFGLNQVVALCVRDDVPLLAAGDLFDDGSDVDPDALAALFTTLRPLGGSGRGLFYVLGNHDRGCDWLAALGPRAIRVSRGYGKGDVATLPCGATVAGLDWVPNERFRDALAGPGRRQKAAEVGLYHQSWTEWMCGAKGGSGNPSVAWLPPHRLSVCGDIHVRGVVDRSPGLAVSPGPLAPQSVVEFAPPAVYALLADFSVREVPLKGRKYLYLDVTDVASADAALAALGGLEPDQSLPERLAAPMAAVRLTARSEEFVDAAARLSVDRGFTVRFIDPGPAKAADAPRSTLQGPKTLLEAIDLSDGPPEAKGLAARLVEAEDPRQLLQAERLERAAQEE